MKNALLALFLALFSLTAAAATSNVPQQRYAKVREKAHETRFADAIEDLPVMPGLEVQEENDLLVIFGSGRIAQTTLFGRVDIDSVYYFYRRVLPELGWQEINIHTYERNAERLNLDASAANAEGMTYVRFSVEPQAAR